MSTSDNGNAPPAPTSSAPASALEEVYKKLSATAEWGQPVAAGANPEIVPDERVYRVARSLEPYAFQLPWRTDLSATRDTALRLATRDTALRLAMRVVGENGDLFVTQSAFEGIMAGLNDALAYAQNERKVDKLRECREVFAEYARQHRAKDRGSMTQEKYRETIVRALANEAMVAGIDEVLRLSPDVGGRRV